MLDLRRRDSGFTLLEILVVLVVLLIAAAILVPAVQKVLQRGKVEGFVRETGVSMQRVRSEAIKHGAPGIVEIDPAAAEVLLYIDIEGDGQFSPAPGANPGTTDVLVSRYVLPPAIVLASPDGQPPVVGFSDSGGLLNHAVFLPDGSIEETGAFRFSDGNRNFFELAVEPRATARIQIRKWHEGQERFVAAGEEPGWRWY